MTTRLRSLCAIASIAFATTATPPAGAASVFVNELHYDNAGGDAAELVELAGVAGLDLAGWSLVLYNGASGSPYATVPLAGSIPDEGSGFGAIGFPVAGIQNGSPDGLAVVDPAGGLVELLSYEGTFLASTGAAAGISSVDIGVEEAGTDDPGFSLQRIGAGRSAADFLWTGPVPRTPGLLNSGQSIAPSVVPLPPAGIVFASALVALVGGRLLRPRPGTRYGDGSATTSAHGFGAQRVCETTL